MEDDVMATVWKSIHSTDELREPDGAAASAWHDIIAAHADEATIFHTREWADHVVAAFPLLEDRSLVFEVESEAGTSRHVLPLFAWIRARGLLTTQQSSFPFQYGGPVPSRDASGTSVLAPLLAELGRRKDSFRIAGNPFAAPKGPPSASLPGGWSESEEYTHLRDLPETDTAFWDDELKPGRRNDVRRMTKKGLLVEESTQSKDISDFYQLYLQSFERWGGRPAFVHPEAYYQDLLRLPTGQVRFTVARWEGRTVGGVFALRYGGKVHYLAGYIDTESRNLRANVLLQIDSIRHSISEGYRSYDFLPSGGNPPVEAFKEGFGGARAHFAVHEKSSWAHQIVHSLRRRGSD